MQDIQSTSVLDGVIETFAEVLDESPASMGPESDFFEFGGNSLLAGLMIAYLRRRFDVKITIREVFTARTAAAIADIVAPRISSGAK